MCETEIPIRYIELKSESKSIMEQTQTAGRGMSVGPVARFISIFLSSKDRLGVRVDSQ